MQTIKEKMIPAFRDANGGLFQAVEKADVGSAYQDLEKQGVALMGWADPFMPDRSLPEPVAAAWLDAVRAESAPHYTAPIGDPALKAALAKKLGAWETIDYSHEDVAQRVLELTDGKKCPVVYDGVGKDTWLTSLDCLSLRGLMVSFGNASGAVTGVNLGILAQKGSLYVTRPTLASYANSPQNLQTMADELFDMIRNGHITVDISQRFALKDAAKAQTELSARRTTGSTILVP